jgi:thiamine biosynthesis lipoprotein
MPAERRLRVMGTTAHVLVVGDAHHLESACARLDDLERRWSRFRPESEISRMNAHAGSHVVVSTETLTLVRLAVDAWHRTRGLFDPTVLPAVRAAGYDRDFASVPAAAAALVPPPSFPTRGCAGVVCDERICSVTLPEGVAIDPGGIGKGLAADLVSGEVCAAGAAGVLVNVGGDLRVRGEPPNGSTWDVAIDDPAREDHEIVRIGLVEGGVATSSIVRRRWQTRVGVMHHLIDPRTGAPSTGDLATVSAVAGEAWWAEVVAKVVLVGTLTPPQWRDFGAHVVTVASDGRVTCDREIAMVAA